jgi:hypothetical protein
MVRTDPYLHHEKFITWMDMKSKGSCTSVNSAMSRDDVSIFGCHEWQGMVNRRCFAELNILFYSSAEAGLKAMYGKKKRRTKMLRLIRMRIYCRGVLVTSNVSIRAQC